MPRAWTRRFVTQQGPQFARTGGLFLFARGDACDDRTLRAARCEGIPSGELCSPATGTGVPFLFLEETPCLQQAKSMRTDRSPFCSEARSLRNVRSSRSLLYARCSAADRDSST